MSAHMRKHHTEIQHLHQNANYHRATMIYIVEGSTTYAIPRKIAEKYVVAYQHKKLKKDSVPADMVFAELKARYTSAGVLLKGLRIREALTQVEFAKKISITQANLSNMEHGKRPIGRQVAKRIEKIFGVNYRYFLE